jgi:hydrogenase/urease accessory protein HupE
MRISNPINLLPSMLARIALLSTLWLITSVSATTAHEIRPAIADVTLSADRIEMEVELTAESLLSGIDLQGLSDTNEAPEAEMYDALRALSPEELSQRFSQNWAEIDSEFSILAGDADIALTLDSVEVGPVGDVELPRDTIVRLSASLPADDTDIRIGWIAANGPIIIRQAAGGDDAYAGYLENGALSEPLPRIGAATESGWSVFFRYIGVGFDHIIPKGLDHILFVLGLFFLSLKMRPLITQVTVFTIAHTITLAMASLGIVTVSPAIVEPLIAASIVYVAIENIFTSKITWWRPIVIFAFGLLHGLGFASVLGEFGLAPGRFVSGLIGFNIGVEIGQLTVIGLAYLAVGYWFGDKPWYRSRISIPASLAIAAVGAYWAIERVFF